MTKHTLDKYARDSIKWCAFAIRDHLAARILFEHERGSQVLLAAATVAHHALEMYLKSALIEVGLTICNPKEIKVSSVCGQLAPDRCAWGHNLIALGRKFAENQDKFDLSKQLYVSGAVFSSTQLYTVEAALEHFAPFFNEIRYPGEYDEYCGVDTDDGLLLEVLLDELRPFLPDRNRCKGWALLDEEL